MNKVKETVCAIIDAFENLLEENDITIPDEDREGNEDEDRIYGMTYGNLETEITEILRQSEIVSPIYFEEEND